MVKSSIYDYGINGTGETVLEVETKYGKYRLHTTMSDASKINKAINMMDAIPMMVEWIQNAVLDPMDAVTGGEESRKAILKEAGIE